MRKRFIILLLAGLMCVVYSGTTVSAQESNNSEEASLEDQRGQASYLYDLKNLIKRSRKNIDRVNEKIKDQAVYKRNLKREDKAREYYEQGLELEAEGKLDVAREYFDKAVRITEHPEMQDYIRESERRFKLQSVAMKKQEQTQTNRLLEEEHMQMEEAHRTYNEAVSLYKQQKFREAKESFEYVDSIIPDFKATRSYIKIVDQDIFQADALTTKLQQEEIVRQQKEVEEARAREKLLWQKEIARKEKDRESKLYRQAEEVYRQALELHAERKYLLARDKFQEVDWVLPNYKKVRAYLNNIEKDIEAESERLAKLKEEELEKKRWEEELAKRRQEEERRKYQQQQEREQIERQKEEASFVYASALELYKNKEYALAFDQFTKVEGIYADYKSTRDYIEKTSKKVAILKEAEKKSEEEQLSKAEWIEKIEKNKAEVEAKKIILEQDKEEYEEKKLVSVAERKENLAILKEKYAQAVKLFKKKKYQQALDIFKTLDSGYRAVNRYIVKIYDKLGLEIKEVKPKEVMVQTSKAAKTDQSNEVATQTKVNVEDSSLVVNVEGKTPSEVRVIKQALYNDAVKLYKAKQYNMALEKFRALDKIQSNYRAAEKYLARIRKAMAKQEKAMVQAADNEKDKVLSLVKEVPLAKQEDLDERQKHDQLREEVYAKSKDVVPPKTEIKSVEVKPVIEDQHQKNINREKEAQQLKDLSAEANNIFKEIDALTQGIDEPGVSKSFSDVQRILSSLAEEQERLAREVEREQQDELKRKRLEEDRRLDAERKSRDDEVKRLTQERKDKAEAIYKEALKAYHARDFKLAKQLFSETNKVEKGYRDIEHYWKDIDSLIVEQQLWEKEDLDKEKIKVLALEASAINEDVLQLTQDKEFDKVKNRFNDLDKILTEIKGIKDAMIARRETWNLISSVKQKNNDKDSSKKIAKDNKKVKSEQQKLDERDIQREKNAVDKADRVETREEKRQRKITLREAKRQAKIERKKNAKQRKLNKAYYKKYKKYIEEEVGLKYQEEVDAQKAAIPPVVPDVPDLIDVEPSRNELNKEPAVRELEVVDNQKKRKIDIQQEQALRELETSNRQQRKASIKARKLHQKELKRLDAIKRKKAAKLKKDYRKKLKIYKAYDAERKSSFSSLPVDVEQMGYESVSEKKIEAHVKQIEDIQKKEPAALIIPEVKFQTYDKEDTLAEKEFKYRMHQDQALLRLKSEEKDWDLKKKEKILSKQKELTDEKVQEVVATVEALPDAQPPVEDIKSSEVLPKEVETSVVEANEELNDDLTINKKDLQEKRQSLLERQKKLREEFREGVELMYKEALKLKKKGKFERSQQKFEEINSLVPGYKKTEKYMHHLTRKLKKKTSAPVRHTKPISTPAPLPEPAFAGDYLIQNQSLSNDSNAQEPRRSDVIADVLDLFDPNVQ